jgi:hypothetical protein
MRRPSPAVPQLAAILYAAASALLILFQLALAAGAPWGGYAMGGRFPGRFPTALRLAALTQAALIAAMAGIVLARAGIGLVGWAAASRRLVWVVVAVSAVTLVLNLITPSAAERAIWAPVAFALLVSSTLVAMNGDRRLR